MSKLKTSILNISFPNPFILAAGPATAKGAMVIEAFKAGWGGAVLKTIGLIPTPAQGCISSSPGKVKEGCSISNS